MKDPRKIVMVIADDHHIVRVGVKITLKEHFDMEIYEASDGEELFSLVSKYKPDVVLLDINMPHTHTQNVLQQLLVHDPKLNVIVFSMNKEEIYGKLFLGIGARGYVPKESMASELVKAIKCVLDGSIYIKKEMQPFYFGNDSSKLSPYSVLTERELEILQFLSKGKSVTDISKTMNLSPSTVGTHKAHIFQKLNVESNVGLIEYLSLYPIN